MSTLPIKNSPRSQPTKLILRGAFVCGQSRACYQASSRVEIPGVTDHPNETWMAQVARNFSIADTRFLHRIYVTGVIMDRYSKFTDHFRYTIDQSQFRTLHLIPMSPQVNGYMKRWLCTIMTDLIRKTYWFDAESPWQALVLHLEHDHFERPHQLLGKDPPLPIKRSTVVGDQWKIVRHPKAGGLINVHQREEAA